MSGPVLDFDPTSEPRGTEAPADTRPGPSWVSEQVPAAFRLGLDEEKIVQSDRLQQAYDGVVEALVERGVDRRVLYGLRSTSGTERAQGMGFAPASVSVLDRDIVWREAKRLGIEGLPETREAFELGVRTRQGGRQRDAETLGRAGTIGRFGAQIVGGGAATFADPINVAALTIPGGQGRIATKVLTDGLVNALVEGATIKERIETREAMDEQTTTADILTELGVAFAGGAAFRGAIEVAPRAARAVGGRLDEPTRPLREAIGAKFADRDLARAFARMVPEHMRSPEQEAAFQFLTRADEIDAASPYVRTYDGLDTHVAKLTDAMAALEEGRIASEAELGRPAVATVPSGASSPIAFDGSRSAFDRVKALIRGPESGGNDAATNGLGSSASGRYQFVRDTFTRLYERVFGGGERAAARAWATQRFDGAVQERLMDALLAENAAVLERSGLAADAGNLYLAHFAGSGKAVELLQAPRNAPVSQYFSPRAIEQNPSYLGEGRTVGEAIDIIRGKVGGEAGAPRAALADLGDDVPQVRPEALDAERPTVAVGGRAVPTEAYRADDIGVDAELMQFKGGGDQFGVTERLHGVQEWDPIAAGMVTVWEGVDGRRLIADGHQRLGLARRIQDATGQEVKLNAFVLRESEGFSAIDARILTALKNIGEGTGTATDAAKVFRDVGLDAEDVLRRLPPRSALVRDGKALARLDGEAFGAVVNDVIPEHYGAAIGALVEDKGLHMAMVRILTETDPPNRLQAEAIIRQAREAAFTRETQDSLFGSEDLVTGLFAQRAKVLDRGLKELRKIKGAFGVAARNADTLETGGNRIDVAGSAAAAEANARALALVDKLALRKGNAVNELLDQAARRLAAGEPLARVLRDFVGSVRKLDLDALARSGDDAGGPGTGPGGSGRAGEPEIGGRLDDDAELSPRDLDARAAIEDTGPSLFDDPATAARFDDPAGEGVRDAADSAWHDIRAQDDFAAPTADQARKALELKTEGRQKGAAPQKAAGEDGGLFDTQDTTGLLFDLDDGKGARSAAEIRAELDADRAGLEEIRKCLK